MAQPPGQYFLLVGQKWLTVSKATYVAAEKAAGFEDPEVPAGEPVTSAFLGLDGSAGATWDWHGNKK